VNDIQTDTSRITTKTFNLRAKSGKKGTRRGRQNREWKIANGGNILIRQIASITGQRGPMKNGRIL
jgi:hypothetical protein